MDAKLQAVLDKKKDELDERAAEFKKSTLARIAASAEKNPRREVARVRLARDGRSSGLRL